MDLVWRLDSVCAHSFRSVDTVLDGSIRTHGRPLFEISRVVRSRSHIAELAASMPQFFLSTLHLLLLGPR